MSVVEGADATPASSDAGGAEGPAASEADGAKEPDASSCTAAEGPVVEEQPATTAIASATPTAVWMRFFIAFPIFQSHGTKGLIQTSLIPTYSE